MGAVKTSGVIWVAVLKRDPNGQDLTVFQKRKMIQSFVIGGEDRHDMGYEVPD